MGKGKLANKKTSQKGRIQSAKANMRDGGKKGNSKGKARGAAIGRRSRKA